MSPPPNSPTPADHVGDRDPAAAPATPGGPLRFARMTGSSIAARNAAAWVTDFLNAAYYRRPADERDVDDLRLAFSDADDLLVPQDRRPPAARSPTWPRFTAPTAAQRFDTERLRARRC